MAKLALVLFLALAATVGIKPRHYSVVTVAQTNHRTWRWESCR